MNIAFTTVPTFWMAPYLSVRNAGEPAGHDGGTREEACTANCGPKLDAVDNNQQVPERSVLKEICRLLCKPCKNCSCPIDRKSCFWNND